MRKITLKNILPHAFAEMANTIASDVWLKEVTFNRGEKVLIEAASGKGKTSLASYIFGYRSDYSGDILFDDKNVRTMKEREFVDIRRNAVSMMFQELRLFPELSAWKNIQIKQQLTGFKEADAAEMFELLGIAEHKDRPIGKMSFGQQQRVALVRSLMQPFDFLIVDEPISHLDDNNAEIMAEIISRHVEKSGAGVIVTSIGKTLPLKFDRVLEL